ncbi:MAG: hypothetical protein CMG54_02610 [Candidatus Marinimicrobia bacterium]|nr:hypothetical protein [Candidatus Neomarinimicrobiota bacterium]
MKKLILVILISLGLNQETIGEGLQGQELIQFLVNNYKTSDVLSYNSARDALYGSIDNQNGTVKCIYTEFSVNNVPSNNPRPIVYEGGIDCEHLWPQSMYDGTQPMKSDIHHLRPCKINVNSSRSNKPYDESIDSQTQNWYWLDYQLNDPPNQNIDKYSESATGKFEPREEVKGDIARAMFYFYTMYSNEADDDFFEIQKDILYQWHLNDSIEQSEITRTMEIANYQDYPNPFILDETLVQRCYFETEFILGDVNQDSIVNVLDIIVIMNYILNVIDLTPEQIALSDMNQDQGINILDIVLLIGEIIS